MNSMTGVAETSTKKSRHIHMIPLGTLLWIAFIVAHFNAQLREQTIAMAWITLVAALTTISWIWYVRLFKGWEKNAAMEPYIEKIDKIVLSLFAIIAFSFCAMGYVLLALKHCK